MTETEEQEWQQRLQDAVEQTLRRKAARRDERREMKARRDAGLEIRHRTKWARIQQETAMPDVPPCCTSAERPCPQHEQAAHDARHQGPRARGGAARRVVGEQGRAKPARPEETRG